ncbi:MAG: hypothetical protein WC156_08025 [Pedobacter sp.]
MNITVDAIDMATEIIKFGLSPRKGQPSRRVLQLVAAYLANTEGTRTAAQTMARQFGLSITSVTEEGVVLSKEPEHESIFMPKRDDIVKEPGTEARLVRGICNAAILACAYQRQQALYSESVQTVTSEEVYELLVEAAAKMSGEETEAPSMRGLTEAARIVERMKADSYSEKSGKPRKQTLRGHIDTTFKYFTDHGLMVKDSEDAGGTYKTLPELRVRLQTQGAQDIADAVLSAVKESSADEAMKEAMNG